MKIAIQGHSARGHEVIQILESLGGKNKWFHEGTNENCFYELHDDYIWCASTRNEHFKYYTLEEFEKEFPFKIGDKVITTGTSHPKIITGITDTQWGLRYVISEIKFPDSKEMPHISQISLYKEMKEERNITLTLDKAKEWYKKGGELKEIALQAYSEEELTKIELPKSWEEFCKQGNPIASWRYNIPTKYEALHKLELLRDCYRGLFITVIGMPVWCITRYKRKLIVSTRIWGTNETFLSFQSLKVAEEYLNNFKPLIKQVEDLI